MRDKSKINLSKFSGFLLIAFLLFSGGNALAKNINFGVVGDNILLNGNVGVGITNPGAKLQVYSGDLKTPSILAGLDYGSTAKVFSSDNTERRIYFDRTNAAVTTGTYWKLATISVTSDSYVGSSISGTLRYASSNRGGIDNTFSIECAKGPAGHLTCQSYKAGPSVSIIYAKQTNDAGGAFLDQVDIYVQTNSWTSAFGFLDIYSGTGAPITVYQNPIDSGITVGGTELGWNTNYTMMIGNVGIGIAPVYKLDVNGAGNFNSFAIHNLGTPSVDSDAATQGYVKSSIGSSNLWGGTLNGNIWNGAAGAGAVGIGTTAPTNELSVLNGAANTNGDSLTVATAQVTGPNWIMNGTSSNGTFLVSTNDPLAVDVGGSIGFAGRYLGTGQFTAAAIKGAKEDGISGNYGGYLAFGTRANGTQISEKMRIAGNGNVGIGITAPANKLEVGSGNIEVGDGYQFGWRYSAGDGNMYNSIVSNYTNGGGIQYKSGSWTGNTTLIAHNFQTWMSSAWQSSLAILQNGNIGIGNTAPGYKLDVIGNGAFRSGDSSYLYFGPNASWGGSLYIGATTNKLASRTGQVIVSDGNLHIDSGSYAGNDIYLNYYNSGHGIRIFGPTNMNGNQINSLGTPTSASDAATKGYVDSASVGNTDTLDGLHSTTFQQRASFGTTASNSGYYKINILPATSWMLSFTIRLYQGYRYDDIRISGYNYGGNYWYSPLADLLNSSATSIDVRFGYDSAYNLWVAVPASAYTGLEIIDITNGYTQVNQDWSKNFSIVNQASLTGTVQTTQTVYRPLKYNENATSATNANTVGGQSFTWSNSSNAPTYVWGADSNGSSYLAARGSMSVNYATSAGNADTVDSKHFNWSGQGGQPTWLWGGNDGTNMYVYNPSNFSVNYAASAGSAPANGGTATALSTNYVGGQQTNPQTYFNQNIGLKVAMTGYPIVWADTLWINGYAGGDVLNMIALHTARNGQARMWLSSQPSNSSSFGTAYEFITSGNIAAQTVSNVSSLAGTWSGINYFLTNNGGYAVNNSSTAALEAYSTGNNSAYMSFHRGGYYAVNFGLDQDNVMRIGGWSAPANLWQLDMGGNQTIAGGMWATAYTYSSDINLKKNITIIQNPLEKILQLRGVTFDWKKDNKPGVGLIAQEVEKVFPGLVNTDKDGLKGVQYGNLVAPLIEAVKAQQKEIDTLNSRIKTLEIKNKK